jgi:CBS domain-containing protein
MTSVADLMSALVVSCSGTTTLGELATLPAEQRIHGVVVLDEAGGAADAAARLFDERLAPSRRARAGRRR